MMLTLQAAQLGTLSAASFMTTVPIATQTPMYKYVGESGCKVYWGINMAWQWNQVVSGLGMAAYRLICFHYLFKKDLNTKKISKYILLAELGILLVMLSLSALMYTTFGWEQALFYQFCMNLRIDEVKTVQEYTSNQSQSYDKSLLLGLRFFLGMFGQAFLIAEMTIYAWILFSLWKHDKENHSNGIITDTMKKERRQKNVITLCGQISTFIVETAFNLYTLIHLSNLSMIESSFIPISQLVVSTIISVIQVLTSHEMRRFLEYKFNLY